MTDLVEIASSGLVAAINPFGAELTHLRDGQRHELMSDADPAFWAHTAPILFPVIGATNGDVIRVDGAEYPMPKHGSRGIRRSIWCDMNATAQCSASPTAQRCARTIRSLSGWRSISASTTCG